MPPFAREFRQAEFTAKGVSDYSVCVSNVLSCKALNAQKENTTSGNRAAVAWGFLSGHTCIVEKQWERKKEALAQLCDPSLVIS